MVTSGMKWLEPELMDVVRLFPGAGEADLFHSCEVRGNVFLNKWRCGDWEQCDTDAPGDAELFGTREAIVKRYAKLSLYRILSAHFQKQLPWGSLTGIRPTRLAYMALEKGDFRPVFSKLGVSEENTELVARVIAGQKGVYERREGNVDLYVSLPFCPSKCSYCSFITAPIERTRQFVPAYLDALEKELSAAAPLIGNLRSVYVGGGTPFVLEPDELERVLRAVAPLRQNGCEYTVEAGRPDVFTREKLDLCAKYGVTRICINAQSFSDRTLQAIGRKHTRAQLYEAFAMTADYPFAVNCDLIAGLTGESVEEFCDSVERAVGLSPANITVHTLCLKKGAKIKEERLLSLSYGENSKHLSSPAYGENFKHLPSPTYVENFKHSPSPACGENSKHSPALSCGENFKHSPAPTCGGGVGEGGTFPVPTKNTPALALLPDEHLAEMIAFSREALTKAGYEPYYLYRQKYMAGAHENVGWTKPGFASVYNIDTMEELCDNLAVGSNAISKKLFHREERIERLASPKDIPTYLQKCDRIIAEKAALYCHSEAQPRNL